MRLLILLLVVSATVYSADAVFFDLRDVGKSGYVSFRSFGDIVFGPTDPEYTEQIPHNQEQLNQPMPYNSDQKKTVPEHSTDVDGTSEKPRVRRDISRATQPPLLSTIIDNERHSHRTDDFQNMLEDWHIIEETAQDGIPFFKHITDLFENNEGDRKRRAVDEEDFKSIQSCVIDAVKEIISCVTKTSGDGLEASEDVGDVKDIGKCIVKAIMDFVVCTAK